MKILKNDIKEELNLRTEKDFPIKGIEFIDIMPLFMDNKIFQQMINKFVLNLKDLELDYIVAPDARGFILGSVIADRLNIGFIPVRKKGKLPPTTVCKEFEYEKEYGKDVLCLPKLPFDESYENKRVAILDDIYATGNTINSINNALKEVGANVLNISVIMNIPKLNNAEDIYSLIDIEEE